MDNSKIKLTVFLPAYNEEKRIINTLESIVEWADEVVVLDKSSTDSTRALVASTFPSVKVVEIPHSGKGEEDYKELFKYAEHDWVFICTCAEVVTKQLVMSLTDFFEHQAEGYDLVYIPRKFYSLGFHNENSPWSFAFYPFLFNKNKIVVTNVIHEHFKLHNAEREFYFTPQKHGVVNHVTHNSVDDYLSGMTGYIKLEAAKLDGADLSSKFFKQAYTQFSMYSSTLKNGGVDSFGQYCAWTMYWHGVMLYAWEKSLGENIKDYNQDLLESLKINEWKDSAQVIRPIKKSITDIKLHSFLVQKSIDFMTKLYRNNRKHLILRKLRGYFKIEK